MTTRLPLTVIGGYLGAGKTTLVNGILSQAEGRRFAVIVNDFGSINIDAGLIRAREGDTISLTNGCMCCSGSDGTAAALARILSRAGEFDHILIEASGVAEPGKIAQNAHGFRLPLEGVIVLADAEQIRAQAANRYVGDVVRRQLRQADLIVLNKVDLGATGRPCRGARLSARRGARGPGDPRRAGPPSLCGDPRLCRSRRQGL